MTCSGAKQALEPVAGKILDLVDKLAAAVVAVAGIALGVFVCEHTADRLHDGWAGEVFAGDHLQPLGLARLLGLNGGPDVRVFLFDEVHGGLLEAGRIDGGAGFEAKRRQGSKPRRRAETMIVEGACAGVNEMPDSHGNARGECPGNFSRKPTGAGRPSANLFQTASVSAARRPARQAFSSAAWSRSVWSA